MKYFKKIFNDCITGIDQKTVDPSRVYLLVAVIMYNALTAFSVYKDVAKWDMQSYGIGFGAILAAGGVGIALKSKTEPESIDK